MAVCSKYCRTLDYKCYELGHTWEVSCTNAALEVLVLSVKDSFRIYLTVYLLTLLLKRKKLTLTQIKKTFHEILQSTLFLGSHGFFYIASYCIVRRLYGKFNYYTVGLVPGFLASFFAILLERRSRRGALAIYVTQVASENVFSMIKERGLVKSVPNGQVYIFMVVMSVLLFLFRNQSGSSEPTFRFLRFIVGHSEELKLKKSCEEPGASDQDGCQSESCEVHALTRSATPPLRRRHNFPSTKLLYYLAPLLKAYQRLIKRIQMCPRHDSCPHPFSCLYYGTRGSLGMFGVGYGFQFFLKLAVNFSRILREPSKLKNIMFDKSALKWGAFLGSFCGIFRFVCCILRHLRNKDSTWHAVPAGFLAGAALKFQPSTTIAMYTMWKTFEILYCQGVDAGHLPWIPHFSILLYSLSTGLLIHAMVVEPHTMRPSYRDFLLRVSANRFAHMNRKLLDVYGVGSSKTWPDYWPQYELDHVTPEFMRFVDGKNLPTDI